MEKAVDLAKQHGPYYYAHAAKAWEVPEDAKTISGEGLTHADVRKVKLIWATKTWGDCFWLDELERLKADGRFEVVHVLSREGRDGCRRGRVTPDLLKEELDEAWGVGTTVERSNVRLISIGTKAMMRDFNDMVYADLDYKYAANRLLED